MVCPDWKVQSICNMLIQYFYTAEQNIQSLTILLELMFSAWGSRLAESSGLWFSHYLNLCRDKALKKTKNIMSRNNARIQDKKRKCKD